MPSECFKKLVMFLLFYNVSDAHVLSFRRVDYMFYPNIIEVDKI